MRLRRLFWIGAASLLGLAALVAIVALLRGELTETDARILGTLAVVLAGGATALTGLALADRRDLVPLGWLVVAVGIAAAALFLWQLWTGFEQERVAGDATIAAAATLLVATARLLHRRLEWLFWVAAALVVASATALVATLHTQPEGDFWPRALGSLLILTVLAWFLVPVLGRLTRASERLVATGPGRFEIELADGERLVVRGPA